MSNPPVSNADEDIANRLRELYGQREELEDQLAPVQAEINDLLKRGGWTHRPVWSV